MPIQKANPNDLNACLQIARALSEWFTEKGLREIDHDIHNLPTYIYTDNDKILGYVCVKEKFDNIIEITQFAVDRNSHRSGVGTKLINFVIDELASNKIIEVKTLDSSCDYEPYNQTRAFYEKNGFTKLEVIDPYPGWGEDNPCAIYVKYPK